MFAAPAIGYTNGTQRSSRTADCRADVFYSRTLFIPDHTRSAELSAHANCRASTRRYASRNGTSLSTWSCGARGRGNCHDLGTPFCRLLHFKRDMDIRCTSAARVLIVAPMSGHYPTLLRGTVEGLLPITVYLTVDRRPMVPVSEGQFDSTIYSTTWSRVHLLQERRPCGRVCSGGAGTAPSAMKRTGDPHVPHSMVLMAGRSTRVSTRGSQYAGERRGIEWFQRKTQTKVRSQPGLHAGRLSGFLQLNGLSA